MHVNGGALNRPPSPSKRWLAPNVLGMASAASLRTM
jgi:hypothetical protein